MVTELKMPALSPTMGKGTLAARQGDRSFLASFDAELQDVPVAEGN